MGRAGGWRLPLAGQLELAEGVDEERLVTALVASAPVAAAVLDRELRYHWVNQALSAMNGCAVADHLGKTPSQVLGDLGTQLEALLRRVVSDDVPLVNHRFRGVRPGHGNGRWLGSYYPLHDEAGRVVAVGALVSDVTDHEHAADRERDFLAALVRVAHAVATQATPRSVYSIVAEEAAGVVGVDGAVVARFRPEGVALLGRWGAVGGAASDLDVVLPASTTPLTELVRRTGRSQRLSTDEPDALGFRTRVAAPIVVNDTLWGAVKAGSPQRAVLAEDAEDRLARFAELVGLAVNNAVEHRRLLDQATKDSLTGLCNRHTFRTRMQNEVERARRHGTTFSLVLLDLDEFKQINDTYGHDVGDAVLVEASRRLEREVRAEDLLARIGGEEFAWVLPDVDGASAWLAAERARQQMAAEPFPRAGRVTLSAGVCDLAEAGDVDTLFRLADRALYHAKTHGRNLCARYADVVAKRDAGTDAPSEHTRTLTALRALARAVDATDAGTFHHSEHVADLAERLARALAWPPERALALRDAARLHDVGKVGVPEQILRKPERLTAAEYEQVKAHPALSYQMARDVLSPEQADWILHHHERWDGKGYPSGLSGEAIPDGAQLLALAEAWETMTIARPYATPMAPTEALTECLRNAGRQFGPAAVTAMRRLNADGALGAGDAAPAA
jgi:diguanylate cyclase (GGDEF)-like protein